MAFLRTRRRAISTIVTTAIMLSAVATIGTAVVAWSNTNVRGYETFLASSASDKTNKINEMFVIENIDLNPDYCGPNLHGLNVTITNTGTLALNVTQIRTSDSIQTDSVEAIKPPATVKPHSSYAHPYCYQYVSGRLTNIQVTTARAIQVTQQVLPP